MGRGVGSRGGTYTRQEDARRLLRLVKSMSLGSSRGGQDMGRLPKVRLQAQSVDSHQNQERQEKKKKSGVVRQKQKSLNFLFVAFYAKR